MVTPWNDWRTQSHWARRVVELDEHAGLADAARLIEEKRGPRLGEEVPNCSDVAVAPDDVGGIHLMARRRVQWASRRHLWEGHAAPSYGRITV